MDKPLRSVPDPIFNDFLYTVLYGMTAEQKRNLHGKYLKAAMNEKSAKSFIKNANDEDKKYILSAAGIRFYWVFSKDSTMPQVLRDMLTKFEKDQKVSALKDIAHNSFFTTSDREYVKLLGLMSSSLHQPSFYFDLELLRANFHLRKWKKRFFNTSDMQAREVEEGANELAKILLMGSVSMDYAKVQSGISADQMKILLYLYTEAHRKISDSYLVQYFVGNMGKTAIRVAIKTLQKTNHIEADSTQSERSYTITGLGVQKVSAFFKTVFSKMKY